MSERDCGVDPFSTEVQQGKAFYCREWAFEKLKVCLEKRGTSATCGTLIMADSGCGKTAFSSQLVSPINNHPTQVALSNRLLAYHFCSLVNIESLSVHNFIQSLSRQLAADERIGEMYTSCLPPSSSSSRSHKDVDEYMMSNIISPLLSLTSSPDRILYLLVDGLEECDDSPAINGGHTIPSLLSKYHKQLPRWLALVCTCSTKAKRISRLFTGFRKLSLDDMSKSHVVQDVQQYILHRLDDDPSLRRYLNKDTAEILDKLHVKCNGCILYMELILDLVAQHSVSLRQVSDIPATLGGLYMWMCQHLFPDVTHYLSFVRPLFSVLLASRTPLTSTQIYNCLTTRHTKLKFEELTDCLHSIAQVLVNISKKGQVVFSHSSFRLWLQDVKFCSRTYLCDAREGHEMLTLYYTVRGSTLTSKEVTEFAHHIQKCNYSSGSKDTSLGTDTTLTLHEQAVWMLLSEAELTSSARQESTDVVGSKRIRTAVASSVTQETVENNISQYDQPPSGDQAAGDCVNKQAPEKDDTPLTTDITVSVESEHCVTSATGQAPEKNGDDELYDTEESPVEDDYLEELDCLDEDLLDSANAGKLVDSELESLDAVDVHQPPATQCQSPEPSCQPVNSGQQEVTTTDSMTLKDAILCGDIDWLERACSEGTDVNIATCDGYIPLVLASAQGQLEVVEMLVLVAGAEVNLPDKHNRTALMESSTADHSSIVSFLLNNDADVNRVDREGRTALHSACVGGHHLIVQLLMTAGADVNIADSGGFTPLLAVCSSGPVESANHVEVVKFLIQSGCDVNVTDVNLQTPLHLVSKRGDLPLCRLLLSSSHISVDPADLNQHTPLLCAVSQGHIEIVYQLIASEADIHHLDQDGRSSLGLACLAGNEDIVKCFLEMGLDEMHRDNHGVDCLHLSTQQGHSKVTHLLLEHGAVVDSQDDQGRTALFVAAQEGHLDCVHTLLSFGADVDLPAHNGKSPLRVTCTCGHVTCARSLISQGADVGFQDMEGRSIVYMLALENKPDCIRMLAEAGADVNACDEQGRTPLHVACWQGHVNVVSTLLDFGADVNSEDNERRTALQSAAWQGHCQAAELLCDGGANVNHMCDQGATPLCIATQEGHLQVVSVLCEHGADPNHADRFGRTALKIAMKASNGEMLHIMENIMRRYKPSLSSQSAKSRLSSTVDQSEPALYENCNTNKSDQSGRSSVELVEPYSVVSLSKDWLSNCQVERAGKESSPHHTPVKPRLPTTQYISESQRRRSAELQQLQSAARSQQMFSIAKVNKLQKLEHINSRQEKSTSRRLEDSDLSSSASDGDDTAPSTPSSFRGDKSNSSHSDSPQELRKSSFTQQLVKLGIGATPRPSNVDQILSGEVGYMANPRVTKALSQVGGKSAPNSGYNVSSRSPAKYQPTVSAGRLQRQPSKASSSKENWVAAVQNTARVPTYKVQYAAADPPQSSPTAYSVRNDDLLGAEHSLSSVKSRQAKIVSNTGSRPNSDSPPLNSSQASSRSSPPPLLPPRRGRQPQPPLHANTSCNRPTLVGVVRPRAQQSDRQISAVLSTSPHSRQIPAVPATSPHRRGQKETSL